MKDEVRQTESAEDKEIKDQNENSLFRSLTEEVQERSKKPETDAD